MAVHALAAIPRSTERSWAGQEEECGRERDHAGEQPSSNSKRDLRWCSRHDDGDGGAHDDRCARDKGVTAEEAGERDHECQNRDRERAQPQVWLHQAGNRDPDRADQCCDHVGTCPVACRAAKVGSHE
jgi:hypothetical protein